MTRLLLFVLSSISLRYSSSAFQSLSDQAERVKRETIRYLPFEAQLQYASVALQNNGMVLYVIKVLEAGNAECFFNSANIDEEALVNIVNANEDEIIGILLLERIPSWALFYCTSFKSPVLSQYVFNKNTPVNVSTQIELRDNSGCKISEPIFSSNETNYIVEIHATCSFALTRNNSMLSLDGVFLNDGNVSYFGSEEIHNITRTYKHGVARAIIVSSKLEPSNIIFIPRFVLELREEGDEKPLKLYELMLLSQRALDGSHEIIPRGYVAIAINPASTIYVRRGTTFSVLCVAYGNPKPKIKWSKDGNFIEGKRKLENKIYWDTFHDRKYLVIEDMDSVKDGEYKCQAQVLDNIVTKSIYIRICNPASVHFNMTKDDKFINLTLSASQDETNIIYRADCYRTTRAVDDARIDANTSPVNIDVTKRRTSWEMKYYWSMTDKGDVPGEMYCEFFTICVIKPMTFTVNI